MKKLFTKMFFISCLYFGIMPNFVQANFPFSFKTSVGLVGGGVIVCPFFECCKNIGEDIWGQGFDAERTSGFVDQSVKLVFRNSVAVCSLFSIAVASRNNHVLACSIFSIGVIFCILKTQ